MAEGVGLFTVCCAGVSDRVAEATGEQIRRPMVLMDPAGLVKDRLLETSPLELGLPKPSAQVGFAVDDVGELRRALGPTVVLDLRTMTWGIYAITNPFGPNRYEVVYIGRARLIRLGQLSVVWQSQCVSGARDGRKATLSELTANDGALLKAMLGEAADTCAQQILSLLSGKRTP
jgi:hypothetical protein